MKRFFSFLAVFAMVFSLLSGCNGEPRPTEPMDPVPDTFQGLVLTVEPGVNVTLYSGFEEGTPIQPSQVYQEETRHYYCYSGLFGAYCCKAGGAGRYTVIQNISMTQEKANTKTVMDVTPGKTTGKGWESPTVTLFTQELLENGWRSDVSMWPDYAEGFATPYFTEEHGEHQMTTQAQLEAYLQGLDDQDDDLYLYNTGYSGMYHHQIPMAVFTTSDLSGADTVEEAAAAMDNGKPTIFYRAHIHGNEPAAGEGALAVIRLLDGSWGHYLEQMNICIIPRGSPDGAQNYERTILGGVDPNRDNLRLRTPEVESYMHLCQVLDPHIIIDGHEYKSSASSQTVSGGDLMLGLGYGYDNTPEFRELMLQMSNEIFANVEENGLDYRYYSNYTNTVNANISRSFAARQGTMFFLVETRGIGCGLSFYERRIATHIASVESIFDQTAQDPQLILTTVAAEKQNIIDKGAVYNTDNVIVLSTKATEDPGLRHDLAKYDQLTGQKQPGQVIPKVYSSIVSQRIAPTAYVIPAGESFTEKVLALMDKHGITYTFIPEGSRVQLQQYDTKESDMLTDETTVTFPKGAYVFCKNQVRGGTLSLLMEPDFEDLAEHQGTLVQQGMITGDGGKYPIYRYIHDLNGEGFINYQ